MRLKNLTLEPFCLLCTDCHTYTDTVRLDTGPVLSAVQRLTEAYLGIGSYGTVAVLSPVHSWRCL